MKKILLILLLAVLLFALGAGIVVLAAWNGVTDESVPDVRATLFGTELSPSEYNYYQPVLGGLLHRQFAGGSGQSANLGSFEGAPPNGARLPEGLDASLAVWRDGQSLYSGAARDFPAELSAQPGAYTFELVCKKNKPQGAGDGVGEFFYRGGFAVTSPPQPEPPPEAPPPPTEPQFTAGRTELQQGDIFAMQVLYLPEGVTPTASTELGSAIFTPVENGWFAAVAIGNVRAVGDYPLRVTAGELSWEVTVSVLPFEFDEQNLIIDTTDPDISEANSPAAIEEYNNVMIPMYQSYDEERYWDGLFIQPAQGWISTQFGEIRYTNGDYSSGRPHWGMDIAAAEDSEVLATNGGRVVYADYLLAVGYTVIIEHGGGLKSYYYHMNGITVDAGQMVEKGEQIGRVGSTGYSTGAHLHFEMRIGGREQAINPSMLFEITDGLYSVGMENTN